MTIWRMDDRRVEITEVNGYTVSTVRLPIDHGYHGIELWYETMIFPMEGDDGTELYCDRYTTIEQAKEGHDKAIQHVKDNY